MIQKVNVTARWPVTCYVDWSKPVEIYIDMMPKGRNSSVTRFLVTLEGRESYIEVVKKNIHYFDYVLTFWDELLAEPKTVLFNGVTPFVKPCSPEKKFAVSSVLSGRTEKYYAPGLLMRKELYERRNEITIPVDFYVSSHLPPDEKGIILGNDKTVVFDCMFHVAINKIRANNFFDEKIVDCFLTKTVPIYFGAKNIGEFFDDRGIISVNSVDDIISVCNRLTIYDYWERLPYIEDNYNKALEYKDFGERLSNEINKILWGTNTIHGHLVN